MKKALIAVLVVTSANAFALGGGHHMGKGHFMDHLDKKLELSDQQRNTLEQIFREQGEKRRALHQKTQERISEVLDDRQRETWQSLREQRKERMQQGHKKRHNKRSHHGGGKHHR